MGDIVCISHLRWDFVWQRPQHLMSRFADKNRILFVEEPVARSGLENPRLEVEKPNPDLNVTIIRLLQPVDVEGWIGHGDPLTQEIYSKLLREYLVEERFFEPLLWFYTPMGSGFIEAVEPKLVVYDVMDQLASFKDAPPKLLEWEEKLLKQADLVFTGGASLYKAKLPFNPRTYLFPSGVDIEHFSDAAIPSNFDLPLDMVGIPKPVLGYYGVIDERMDFTLLAEVAKARPDWTILLIGPVLKIAKEEIPAASNIITLPMKTYKELPAYLAFFDVALIPFALNEATHYLSPTKTLEYMAAHKPIVSTPINDVVELYGSVVRVGRSPAEFVDQINAALLEKAEVRKGKEAELLAQHTWNSIAERMSQLIENQLENPSNYNSRGNIVDQTGRVQVQA